MKTRALTTSEAAVRLMDLGYANHFNNVIPDNELTEPFGKSGDGIYFSLMINDYINGKTYLGIYKFKKDFFEGRCIGANVKRIVDYSKLNAAGKKHFMQVVEGFDIKVIEELNEKYKKEWN